MEIKRSRVLLWLAGILFMIVGGFALYVWAALHWSYSEGERAGYIQKFSSRGWLCKTWEGELAMISIPGSTPDKFFFSVRSKAVAGKISETAGKRVVLVYEQHKGVPTTCFGETEYYVVAVRPLE